MVSEDLGQHWMPRTLELASYTGMTPITVCGACFPPSEKAPCCAYKDVAASP